MSDDDPFKYDPLPRIKHNQHINFSLSSQNLPTNKSIAAIPSSLSSKTRSKKSSTQTNIVEKKIWVQPKICPNPLENDEKVDVRKKGSNLCISKKLSTENCAPVPLYVVSKKDEHKETNECTGNTTILSDDDRTEIFETPDLNFDGLIDLNAPSDETIASLSTEYSLNKRAICSSDITSVNLLSHQAVLDDNITSGVDESVSSSNKNVIDELISMESLKNISLFDESISNEPNCDSNESLSLLQNETVERELSLAQRPTSVQKVDQWLSSINNLTSTKEERLATTTLCKLQESNSCWHQKRKSTDTGYASKSAVNDYELKDNSSTTAPCIHLHFHVNSSPNKFVQSTLDHFLSPNKKLKMPTSVDIISENQNSLSSSSANGTNSVDTTNAWKNILGAKKSVTNLESHSSLQEQPQYGTHTRKKYLPYYKRIINTSFVVDAFNYGTIENVSCYFLSHYHYDHYIGLNRHFKESLYCSKITANLVRLKLRVADHCINVLPMSEPRVIEGVEVTLLDAHHCPGAVMFLFKFSSGKSILHVGDFRAHESMESIPSLTMNIPLDALYLDTTYLDPLYVFPLQEEVLNQCRLLVRKHLNVSRKEVRFAVGTYSIGKEKFFLEIANELDCSIYANPEKIKLLKCLDDPQMCSRLTKDKNAAKVHVVPMKDLSMQNIRKYVMPFGSNIEWVCFKPTGWTYNSNVSRGLHDLKPICLGNISIYGLPYSEHSSYAELERFVKFCRPEKIISTVKFGKEVTDTLNTWSNHNSVKNSPLIF